MKEREGRDGVRLKMEEKEEDVDVCRVDGGWEGLKEMGGMMREGEERKSGNG